MKLSLRVDVNGMYWHGGACIEIPEMHRLCFEPMKTCDEPMLRMVTGDISNETAKVVMKTREDAADILAKELANMIVSEMKKKDTHNGNAKTTERQVYDETYS